MKGLKTHLFKVDNVRMSKTTVIQDLAQDILVNLQGHLSIFSVASAFDRL